MDTKKTPLKMSIRTKRLKNIIKNVYYTTQDDNSFNWIDDREYKKNKKRYDTDGYRNANGATIQVGNAVGFSKDYVGKWVTLNEDMSLSIVPPPNFPTAFAEYDEEELKNPLTAMIGGVDAGIDRGSPKEMKPGGGLRNVTYKLRGGHQVRWFGDDGKAIVDIDYGHDDGVGDPHHHWWEGGSRGEGIASVPDGWEVTSEQDDAKGTLEYGPPKSGFLPILAPGQPISIRPMPVRVGIPFRLMFPEPVFVP